MSYPQLSDIGEEVGLELKATCFSLYALLPSGDKDGSLQFPGDKLVMSLWTSGK